METSGHSDGLSPRALDMLEEPIDPDLVRHNDFNAKKPDFEYIDREAAISNANRIFGYDGWSYRIVGDVNFTETPSRKRDGQEVRQGFYKAIISLSVRGVGARDGVGTWEIASDMPSSHDTAAAAAVTRALKRALSTFGPQFGLELRSESGRRSGARARPARSSAGRTTPTARVGGAARSVKAWADSAGVSVPVVCALMGISALSDSEVGEFMAGRGIERPERIPAALDRLRAAGAA